MSETGELYRAMHREAAEKKRENLRKSTAILRNAGIDFEAHNGGLHLIIRTAAGAVNFFPSTGRFTGVFDGRGVFNLLKLLEGSK